MVRFPAARPLSMMPAIVPTSTTRPSLSPSLAWAGASDDWASDEDEVEWKRLGLFGVRLGRDEGLAGPASEWMLGAMAAVEGREREREMGAGESGSVAARGEPTNLHLRVALSPARPSLVSSAACRRPARLSPLFVLPNSSSSTHHDGLPLVPPPAARLVLLILHPLPPARPLLRPLPRPPRARLEAKADRPRALPDHGQPPPGERDGPHEPRRPSVLPCSPPLSFLSRCPLPRSPGRSLASADPHESLPADPLPSLRTTPHRGRGRPRRRPARAEAVQQGRRAFLLSLLALFSTTRSCRRRGAHGRGARARARANADAPLSSPGRAGSLAGGSDGLGTLPCLLVCRTGRACARRGGLGGGVSNDRPVPSTATAAAPARKTVARPVVVGAPAGASSGLIPRRGRTLVVAWGRPLPRERRAGLPGSPRTTAARAHTHHVPLVSSRPSRARSLHVRLSSPLTLTFPPPLRRPPARSSGHPTSARARSRPGSAAGRPGPRSSRRPRPSSSPSTLSTTSRSTLPTSTSTAGCSRPSSRPSAASRRGPRTACSSARSGACARASGGRRRWA